MQHSIFVISSAGSDITPIRQTIEQLGGRVLNVESVTPGSEVYLASSIELIRHSTAVVAVVEAAAPPNLLFELGVAVGTRRPVLLFAPTEVAVRLAAAGPPSSTVQHVDATLANGPALTFHIEAFLEKQPVQPASTLPRVGAVGKQQPLLRSRSRASHLEHQALELLARAPEVEAIREQPDDGRQRYIPDFALWLDDPSQTLGNPVMVEVRGTPATAKLIDRIRAYAVAADVRTVLLVTSNGPARLEARGIGPLMFFVGFPEFTRLVESGRLVEAMRLERNRLVHSAR